MKKANINIYDIAKEAGVSPATVSRVLTGKAKVSEEKRAAVQKVIDKYQFKPNAMARGLNHTQMKIMGILIRDIQNPYESALFSVCEKEAIKSGYDLRVRNCANQELSKKWEEMAEKQVDAIISIGAYPADAKAGVLEGISEKIPVILNEKVTEDAAYQVVRDEKEAMEQVFSHLLALGHKQIAFAGPSESCPTAKEQRLHYQNLMKANGLDIKKRFCIESMGAEGARKSMKELYQNKKLPTAILASDDLVLAGIYEYLKADAICVPKDISLVSLEETWMSKEIFPEIATVSYDLESYAKKIVAAAIALIEQKPIERCQMISPVIQYKASCAKARKKKG